MTHLAFELRTSTPDSWRLRQRDDRGGPRAASELDGSKEFLSGLPAYAAHFSRTGVKPEQTWIAAGDLGELRGLLEPWRNTVDEVLLVPVSAAAPGPARDLVDAAIAAF